MFGLEIEFVYFISSVVVFLVAAFYYADAHLIAHETDIQMMGNHENSFIADLMEKDSILSIGKNDCCIRLNGQTKIYDLSSERVAVILARMLEIEVEKC
jgi:hypothetical protein